MSAAEQAKKELHDTIKRFVQEQCTEKSHPEVNENDNLWDDLGLKSENVASVIETVQTGYGLEADKTKQPKDFQTVGDLCKYLEGQLG